jgi:hypothetical protein
VFDLVRIHTKLAAALAVPLLALVALSGFVVILSVRDADAAELRAERAREQVALATSALGPTGVLSALQTERNAAGVTMLGMNPTDNVGELEEGVDVSVALRVLTDQTVEQFKANIGRQPESVRTIYQPAIAALDQLPGIRTDMDEDPNPRDLSNPVSPLIYDRYTGVVTAIFDANSAVALAVDDASMRNGATLIDVTARDREYGTQLTSDVLRSFLPGTPVTQALVVAETRMLVRFSDDQLRKSAAGPYEAIVEESLTDPRIAGYRDLVDNVITGRSSDIMAMIGPAATETWNAWTELDQKIGAQLNADADAVQAAAEDEAQAARDRQRNVGVLAIVVIFVAGAVTLVASRSISRPLRRLATEAEDMAARRLPDTVQGILDTPLGEDVVIPNLDPVATEGGVEIAEVAHALNAVQTSAADLAVEQALLRRNIADSFVNLGRRNQSLLSRQIDSITQMEREEADPDILERLFTLDHLATRMRRNAESLLLLGGLEPHRQWSQPVPIVEAVRGALGEVEDYERVEIHHLDEALVKGSTIADVTHLLAELIENALTFSPEDRLVEVVGRSSGGGYSLAIVDDGVGMTDEELAEANRRISGRESFTVAPSRYLGHYVVGVQASRLGVTVRLHHSPTGGVMAQIELGAVLADTEDHQQPADHQVADADTTRDDALVAEVDPSAEAVGTSSDSVPASDDAGSDVHNFVAETEPERFVPPVGGVSGQVSVETSASAPLDEDLTPIGYRRRVRGANTPRTEVQAAHQDGAGPAGADEDPGTPESVRDLLSDLQAGTERALAEGRDGRGDEG